MLLLFIYLQQVNIIILCQPTTFLAYLSNNKCEIVKKNTKCNLKIKPN